jgi:catechol 2,3-dioxygenase-like lactoylglutathione lyase family enzyme
MKKIDLIVDCTDPARLAEFWSAALGYEKVHHFGHYTLLTRGGPGFPRLALQQVPEPKEAKNRMHLDIIEADIEAEAARLEALGAGRLEAGPRREELDHAVVRWIVMADPEGNEFCVA